MDDGRRLGTAGLVKGWCAVLAALGAGAVLYWDVGGLASENETLKAYHRELGFACAAFGFLLALAVTFHGTEFGFRVQSLLLCLGAGGVTCLFALKGFAEGWGVGSGALTFIFGVFALVKLKQALLGRTPEPEEG